MNNRLIKIFLTLVSATLVMSCGGGGGGGVAGGGGGGGGGTTPGIDRLGVASGVVSGFGSIFVNGVEFETDSAEFEIDDDSVGSSQDDLNVGDTVIVTFDPDVAGNVAQTVFSDDLVEGPIDSIDPVLVVAGQTVLVDAATSFDDSLPIPSLAGLMVGDFIEVNGLFDSNGDIRATRIEPGVGEVEVHGVISGLDTGAQTFAINNLVVNYDGNTVIDDNFPGGSMFADGDFAEVKGANPGPNSPLLATKIEAEGLGLDAADGLAFDDFDEVQVELEGFITRFASATDFDVSGFPVRTNSGTVFDGGGPVDLALNVKVEVEGDLNSNNVLVADKVDIRRANDLRVTALVDEDAVGDTIMLLGITVRVDALTRIEDKTDAEVPASDLLGVITANDYVEARGGADPSGAADILASLLEREDPPDVLGEDTELRGFVDTLADPSLTVAGVTIDTNAQTVFRNIDDSVMTAADFFATVQDGDLVDINGTEGPGNTILAEEVSLE
jgi:hypothetical protein